MKYGALTSPDVDPAGEHRGRLGEPALLVEQVCVSVLGDPVVSECGDFGCTLVHCDR
jgi:hypothetical protein